jgi:aminoglycoside 6'-N-acetyltransferase I
METRELQRDDVEAWVTLRRTLWPHADPDSLLADADQVLSSPDEICFLLIHPSLGAVGFIEGAVHPGPETPYAHVEAWYVAPEFRRQGYGRKLLDRLENWCLHRTICYLTSDTGPDYPISPRAHASCGFRVLTQQTIFIKELQQSAARDADRPRP